MSFELNAEPHRSGTGTGLGRSGSASAHEEEAVSGAADEDARSLPNAKRKSASTVINSAAGPTAPSVWMRVATESCLFQGVRPEPRTRFAEDDGDGSEGPRTTTQDVKGTSTPLCSMIEARPTLAPRTHARSSCGGQRSCIERSSGNAVSWEREREPRGGHRQEHRKTDVGQRSTQGRRAGWRNTTCGSLLASERVGTVGLAVKRTAEGGADASANSREEQLLEAHVAAGEEVAIMCADGIMKWEATLSTSLGCRGTQKRQTCASGKWPGPITQRPTSIQRWPASQAGTL
ncbi:hypothetical protein C8R47DRAFT_1244820 [Mycena vitilis]|nr:hypothetical protein C8R47DRAFT_1244820 [Mycena vitilis]